MLWSLLVVGLVVREASREAAWPKIRSLLESTVEKRVGFLRLLRRVAEANSLLMFPAMASTVSNLASES